MSDIISKQRQQFGEFLKTLRQSITPITTSGVKSWTQTDLANTTGITLSTIKRIETGQVNNISVYLEALGDAFGLDDIAKQQFYAVAGYVYPQNIEKVEQIDRERLRNLLTSIDYPASVRTPLWDFIAFNEYHRVLWGYPENPSEILEANDDVLGSNLLRISFDPDIPNHPNAHASDLEALELVVRQFRQLSLGYINTKRYNQIITEMQRFEKFNHAWIRSLALTDKEISLYRDRGNDGVNHPEYGEIEFMSLRSSFRHLHSSAFISVYVPTKDEAGNYQKLQQAVLEDMEQNPSKSWVHEFTQRPID